MSYVDRRGKQWIRTSSQIQQQAKALRQEMTKAEEILWAHLRRSQICGVSFRRQHPYGPYIFDFYSPKVRMVIEVDGDSHDEPLQKLRDAERDDICRDYGLTILRFRNEQVLFQLDTVLLEITNAVTARL